LASWWLSGCSTWSVPGAASSSALTIPPWSKLLADWPAHGIGGIPRSTRRMEKSAASNHCDWNFRRS
jgi:hypothetical protein